MSSGKRALITGIAGQDGSYLAEILLEKDYRVYGLVRHRMTGNLEKVSTVLDRVRLIEADLLDQNSLINALSEADPDEIYNLASPGSVPKSWSQPVLISQSTALGPTRLLEAIRRLKPTVRFFQASSSQMYGLPETAPQNEQTPFDPHNPYAVAKLYGHWITVNYRESFGLFAVSGILFNHESPRRTPEFVTRKIAAGVASIRSGSATKLRLGNLEARRDWGYARDYMEAAWSMLQNEQPEDFVIATGESHSVRDFCEIAFARVGLDYRDFVEVDPKLVRSHENGLLLGDPRKARKKLGWKPKTNFRELVALMIDAEMERANGLFIPPSRGEP